MSAMQKKIKLLEERVIQNEIKVHDQNYKIDNYENSILQISKILNELKGNVYEVTKSFV